MKKINFIAAVKLMLYAMPLWTREMRILLIAGRECIVEYNPAENTLKITEKRCTFCGQCCMSLAPNSDIDIHWGTDEEGKCLKLLKEGDKWKCSAGNNTPIRCFPDVTLNNPECGMEYHIEEISI